MTSFEDRADTARAMWRRQILLSGLAVAAMLPVAGVYVLARGEWGRDPDNAFTLWLAAGAVIIGLAALLAAALWHTVRVARFTFGRGDT